MKKKGLILIVSVSMLCMNTYSINAKDFSGRESEMNKKCAVIYDQKTQQECKDYKAYLENKSENLSNEIDDIKSQISSVKGNIDSLGAQVKKNSTKILAIDKQMVEVQDSITKIGNSIDSLNLKIKNKEIDIKDRDEKMRDRLVEMQPYTGSNNFIDFIMGSSSFSDLLRRTQILGELNSYESEQIKTLNKEKSALNEDKEQVVEQKELLEVQKKELTSNKARAKALNEVNEELITKYRTQEDKLLDQKIKAQMAQVSMPKIDTSLAEGFDDDDGSSGSGSSGGGSSDDSSSDGGSSGGDVTPSTNFQVPIQGTWYRSAGTWAYPSGNVHRGMDFGTYQARGLRVVAPASGIIIWTHNGCASPAGNNYPNSCGVPQTTGNNLTMLTRVNGVVYAFSFYHLTSTVATTGSTVKQGQLIAYTGNSGNSTGPHCHVEMIKVGTMSLASALTKFNNSGDLSFGVGWGQDPHACGGYGAPCRLRPENYFM